LAKLAPIITYAANVGRCNAEVEELSASHHDSI
jgi:hypothetical protein